MPPNLSLLASDDQPPSLPKPAFFAHIGYSINGSAEAGAKSLLTVVTVPA